MTTTRVQVIDLTDGDEWARLTIGAGATERILTTALQIKEEGGTVAFRINGVLYNYAEGLGHLKNHWAKEGS